MPKRKIDWYGPRLRQLRGQAALSQAELGRRVDLAGSQINKLETNVNQPTLATALAIAEALGVPITEFVSAGQPTGASKLTRPRSGPTKATPSTPPAADLEDTQQNTPAAKAKRTRKRRGE
jgi:transcriptional regulator with XRE-family HTH domain